MEETLPDSSRTARIFKVLSVDTRINILQLLKDHALCVNAIANSLGITAAAASQHLRVMRDSEIVIAEKKGYFVHYRINKETMRHWREVADAFLVPDND